MPVPDRYYPIRNKNMVIWLIALSTFIMSRVCDFIKNEVPMDKGFRMKDLKAVAEVVLKFYGREVQPEHVYNHMRHWRAR
jgi:hypothetical protein